MITRIAHNRLLRLARSFRAVAVVGPRQSGKTVLCRSVFNTKPYVSLENPDVWEFSKTDPRGFLGQFPKGAILDEVQKAPHLFNYLQQLLDETNKKGLFVLTGSSNFLMQEGISQTLAGRVGYLELLPLSIPEIAAHTRLPAGFAPLAFKGGYPELYKGSMRPINWYPNYVNTYLERDVRQLKNLGNPGAYLRFLKLCAGRVGQILNLASLANDCGIDAKTAASWLSVLQTSFIVYLLKPWHVNFNKRVIKSPKLYFYDTGLASHLLGIERYNQIVTHAAKGALFENLMITEVLKARLNAGLPDNLYYWRDKTGHEIDLILDMGGKPVALELKAGETIGGDYFNHMNYFDSITEGRLQKILVYAGEEAQKRDKGLKVIPWPAIASVI
ncbi:MAG TPA: ATP-binding protein [Phnomibacter sp.]|nr:ATP-binding protein [Phnomibacter sp.]